MPKKDPKSLSHGKPWASLLSEYEPVIRELRKARRTYREISDLLRERHGVHFSHTAIWKFVRVRATRTQYVLPEPGQAPVPSSPTPRPSPAKGRGTAAEAAQATTPAPAAKPRTKDPQTTRMGFPLPAGQEVIGHDELGRPLSRNKPFFGEI